VLGVRLLAHWERGTVSALVEVSAHLECVYVPVHLLGGLHVNSFVLPQPQKCVLAMVSAGLTISASVLKVMGFLFPAAAVSVQEVIADLTARWTAPLMLWGTHVVAMEYASTVAAAVSKASARQTVARALIVHRRVPRDISAIRVSIVVHWKGGLCVLATVFAMKERKEPESALVCRCLEDQHVLHFAREAERAMPTASASHLLGSASVNVFMLVKTALSRAVWSQELLAKSALDMEFVTMGLQVQGYAFAMMVLAGSTVPKHVPKDLDLFAQATAFVSQI
jgi:hypothetical protein